MRRKLLLPCLVILGSALALSIILVPLNAEARDIKVGIVDCYSGPPAVYCKDALNGFKLALKDINKKGA